MLTSPFADAGAMLSAISDAEQDGARQKSLIARGHQISEELPRLTPDAIRSILMTLVNRVSDCVIAVNYGKVQAMGSPAEVQIHPDVVAAYLGA